MQEADGARRKLAREAIDMKKMNKEVNRQVCALQDEMVELKALIRRAEDERRPPVYVQNPKSGVVHKVLTSLEHAGIHARSVCSYKWVAGAARKVDTLPRDADLICDTCMGEQKADMANAA